MYARSLESRITFQVTNSLRHHWRQTLFSAKSVEGFIKIVTIPNDLPNQNINAKAVIISNSLYSRYPVYKKYTAKLVTVQNFATFVYVSDRVSVVAS